MLFGGCGCGSGASLLSQYGPLCAGGTGFIGGMLATFAAHRRIAPAMQPGPSVPRVDKVAVRIVTDNVVINFVPSEQREGLTIERGVRYTHPDRPPRFALQGEWGLSMHAQSTRDGETRHVLVDFGYTPEVINNNLALMGIDAADIDAMVLSHGHFDHFGGMTGFLAANKGRLKKQVPFFVGGEDCFCIRRNPGGNFGALDRRAILDSGLQLMFSEGPAIVADHAFTTGRIAQQSFEEPLLPTQEVIGIRGGFGCYAEDMPQAKNTGDYIYDDFDHEIATNFLVGDRGLVVLTSCSHRGVINAVRQAQAVSGIDRVLAVIGGFHIVPPLGDDYIDATIAAFREIDPAYIIPAHCSGDRFYDRAREVFGERVVHSAVGTRFVFSA